jgi:hypothetical protein
MATLYLPRITAAQHEIFRNFVQFYPTHTYKRWLEFQAKEIADWEADGGEVILVDVSPDEFLRYCHGAGACADIHTLRGVAFVKGTGKFR